MLRQVCWGCRDIAGLLLNRQRVSQPANQPPIQPIVMQVPGLCCYLCWSVAVPGVSAFLFFFFLLQPNPPNLFPWRGIVFWSSAAAAMKKVWKLGILLFHRCCVSEGSRLGSVVCRVVAGTPTLLLLVAGSPLKAKEGFVPPSDQRRARGAR